MTFFGLEIGSGFGEQRGTPHVEYPGVPSFPHGQPIRKEMRICLQCIYLTVKKLLARRLTVKQN